MPSAGLRTLAGRPTADADGKQGLSLADLLESDGWRDERGIGAEIVGLVEPDGGVGSASSVASEPDSELAALTLFNTVQVMPEREAEDYGATQ